MKLVWCCLTAALLTITKAAVDVEKTVEQVQNILKANTLLPRLTREEIISLLNDIRAEDATSKPATKVKSSSLRTTKAPVRNSGTITTTTTYENIRDNEINSAFKEDDVAVSASASPNLVDSTTTSSRPTLTVVLPYTPRDGSSLQELYTKPPRVQVVAEAVTPKPVKLSKSKDSSDKTLKNRDKTPNKLDFDLPAELQAFLDSHGLKGKPGQDNFLLPLDGFKPLPPARIVDGNVELPENLLLTYDLISPSDLAVSSSKNQKLAQTNFLYEPLRPEFPFELDTASSESKHTVLPLDLPKPRKTKAVPNTPRPNYEPLDYEAVKVIPLNQGPNPAEDEVIIGVEQSKRQANISDDTTTTTSSTSTTESTTAQVDTKNANVNAPETLPSDTVPSESDTGASIADLEDSFGGAAPVQPGDSELPPPRKNGFYWMVDWNSFLEVGDGDSKVNIRFEPKLGDPQMFLPVNVP